MPVRGRLTAEVPFVDGVARPVFEESDSRQFVIGDDGRASMESGCYHPTNHRRCSTMLVDVAQEIGARMGRVKAIYILGCGLQCRDTPWDGLYPLDPDLDDELEKAGIRPGTEEFEEAEAAAQEAYEYAMETEFCD
jgi:hypothetical protein